MNFALILSGGVGSRMRSDGFPKQYIEVKDKPILLYTLEKFQTFGHAARNEEGRWRLTPKGFLISNTIISDLLLAQENSEPLAKRR